MTRPRRKFCNVGKVVLLLFSESNEPNPKIVVKSTRQSSSSSRVIFDVVAMKEDDVLLLLFCSVVCTLKLFKSTNNNSAIVFISDQGVCVVDLDFIEVVLYHTYHTMFMMLWFSLYVEISPCPLPVLRVHHTPHTLSRGTNHSTITAASSM